MGFSYLVPDTVVPKEQQKYFSTVFRSLNHQGEKLSPQESRRSLYFLDNDLEDFFEPKSLKNIPNGLDFVRYLSLLSQH